VSPRLLLLTNLCLAAAVLASALGVVWVKHQNRKAFGELQQSRAERDALEVEWGQLQLEQSAWATHPRIEQLARDQFDMQPPDEPVVIVDGA
jgi:cell division protein FtsL